MKMLEAPMSQAHADQASIVYFASYSRFSGFPLSLAHPDLQHTILFPLKKPPHSKDLPCATNGRHIFP